MSALTEFQLNNDQFSEDEIMNGMGNLMDCEGGLIIENVLSESECDLIAASLFKQSGSVITKESKELADLLYFRVGRYCTYELNRKNPTNANEILYWRNNSVDSSIRFIRYKSGEAFPVHTSGEQKRDDKVSLFSIVIYLNDFGKDFNGGEFRYYKKDIKQNLTEVSRIQQKKGLAIILPQTTANDSLPITSGEQLVIRLDVLYAKATYEEEYYDEQ